MIRKWTRARVRFDPGCRGTVVLRQSRDRRRSRADLAFINGRIYTVDKKTRSRTPWPSGTGVFVYWAARRIPRPRPGLPGPGRWATSRGPR
jgi:hypothetical protein